MEYSEGKGQIQGGRWKPFMYLLKRVLFTDLIVTCSGSGDCFCRNDGIDPFHGVISIDVWDLVKDKLVDSNEKEVFLEGGKAAVGKLLKFLLN